MNAPDERPETELSPMGAFRAGNSPRSAALAGWAAVDTAASARWTKSLRKDGCIAIPSPSVEEVCLPQEHVNHCGLGHIPPIRILGCRCDRPPFNFMALFTK